jgi:hypothetical protein
MEAPVKRGLPGLSQMSEAPAKSQPRGLSRRVVAVAERLFPLWTLRWRLRRFNRAYDKAIREANSPSSKDNLESEAYGLSEEFTGPVREIRTRRVLRDRVILI